MGWGEEEERRGSSALTVPVPTPLQLKDLEAGEWWEFNDSTVTPIKESALARAYGGYGAASAYMLLYRSKAEASNATPAAPLPTPPRDAPSPFATAGRRLGPATPANDSSLANDAKRLRLSPARPAFLDSDTPPTDEGEPTATHAEDDSPCYWW